MQTDTVVGIVGAVVLVSVMVGVFTYEYNNASDANEVDGGDGASMTAFNATYPDLSASDDLDGDGTPNHMDDDLDGDGIPNEADDAVSVSSVVDGTVAQSAGTASADSQTFVLGEGAQSFTLTLTYDRPTPLPAQQAPRIDWELIDPNGITEYNIEETDAAAPSSTVTVTIEFGGDLEPGEWTLTATSTSLVSTEMSYSGELVVGYAGAADAMDA